jgi:hypothetical protein
MQLRFLRHHEWTQPFCRRGARRGLVASLCTTLALAACKDASNEDVDEGDDDGSTSGAATTGDAESSTALVTDADTTAAEAEGGTTFSTEDGGATESTGDVPSGDVWVDAEGTVIGLYRVTTDEDEEAVEGLVDSMDATWRVSDDRMFVGPVEAHGMVYWESTDCTGPRYFADPNDYDPFREGIVTRISTDFFEVTFVIPPDTAQVEITFASWWNTGFGCVAEGLDGDFDDPTSFYAEKDLLLVEPPVFVPPLTIEHL